eukprot:jgi/Ulvmu1/10222/UM060_0022.1
MELNGTVRDGRNLGIDALDAPAILDVIDSIQEPGCMGEHATRMNPSQDHVRANDLEWDECCSLLDIVDSMEAAEGATNSEESATNHAFLQGLGENLRTTCSARHMQGKLLCDILSMDCSSESGANCTITTPCGVHGTWAASIKMAVPEDGGQEATELACTPPAQALSGHRVTSASRWSMAALFWDTPVPCSLFFGCQARMLLVQAFHLAFGRSTQAWRLQCKSARLQCISLDFPPQHDNLRISSIDDRNLESTASKCDGWQMKLRCTCFSKGPCWWRYACSGMHKLQQMARPPTLHIWHAQTFCAMVEVSSRRLHLGQVGMRRAECIN